MSQIQRAIRFEMGRVVITANANNHLSPEDVRDALHRHLTGDWGDIPSDDRKANEYALENGLRLVSSYQSIGGTRFWIITEADRSYTTVLLPEDY